MSTLVSYQRYLDDQAAIWRQQMLQAQSITLAATTLSSTIASTIATQQLATVASSIEAAVQRAIAPSLDIAAHYEAMLKPIFANADRLEQILTAALQPIAAIAALDWGKRFASWSEEERKLDDALRPFGWWALTSWTPDQARQAIQIGRTEGRRALDAAICDHFRHNRCRALRKMVVGWMDETEFKLRRPIIQDAMKDHASGRYRVSVPTLLPVVEGVVAAVFEPSAKHPGKAIRHATQDERLAYHRVLVDAMVTTLTAIWQPSDFTTANPRTRTLNRHLILHGRSVGYGTEVNSLKVFLALDQIASEVETKRQRDRTQAA